MDEARKEFNQHVQGENFMTPHPVEFGFIGDSGIAYEISQGEGFNGQKIYGFSVGLPISDPRRRELSDCFKSMAAVRRHLAQIEV